MAPSPPAGSGVGSAVSSPAAGLLGAPAAKRLSRVLSVQSGLFRQFSVTYCSVFHSSNFFAKARAMKNNRF